MRGFGSGNGSDRNGLSHDRIKPDGIDLALIGNGVTGFHAKRFSKTFGVFAKATASELNNIGMWSYMLVGLQALNRLKISPQACSSSS